MRFMPTLIIRCTVYEHLKVLRSLMQSETLYMTLYISTIMGRWVKPEFPPLKMTFRLIQSDRSLASWSSPSPKKLYTKFKKPVERFNRIHILAVN